jgi:hypothetical protein
MLRSGEPGVAKKTTGTVADLQMMHSSSEGTRDLRTTDASNVQKDGLYLFVGTEGMAKHTGLFRFPGEFQRLEHGTNRYIHQSKTEHSWRAACLSVRL